MSSDEPKTTRCITETIPDTPPFFSNVVLFSHFSLHSSTISSVKFLLTTSATIIEKLSNNSNSSINFCF